MEQVFNRSGHNPLITAADLHFPASAVMNAGAVEHDGDVVLLLRVEGYDGMSNIHVARSRNGVTDWQVDPRPLIRRGEKQWRYEEWGCEDARVVYLPDKQAYYITYTACSPSGVAAGLARTSDFQKIERIGLILSPGNRDVVLFPAKFDGKYAVLHRPDVCGTENIWLAFSPDLLYWGEPHAVLPEGVGPAWNAVKVGSGPSPVETSVGWLLLYQGAKYYAGSLVYRVGAVILDRECPYRVSAAISDSIFSSHEAYEISGLVPNTVFPTGMLLRGDELWVYYGAAGCSICLATIRLSELLDLFG